MNPLASPQSPAPEVNADSLREALEPFVTAAKVIAGRPQDYGNRIVSIGGLVDACDLTKLHFERLLAALAPQPPAPITTEQQREAIARIINPGAFAGDKEELTDMWPKARRDALGKADAILALSPPVTTDRAAVNQFADYEIQAQKDLETVTVEFVASRGLSKVTSWVERSRGDEISRLAIEARALVDAKEEETL